MKTSCLTLLIVLAVVFTPLVGSARAEEPEYSEPPQIPDAVASTEEQMKPYTEIISGTDVTFDMVPIPAGTVLLGSPEDEEDRKEDRKEGRHKEIGQEEGRKEIACREEDEEESQGRLTTWRPSK